MRVTRSIAKPIRQDLSWDERWKGPDRGLIACWERGREKAKEHPELAASAKAGQLPVLGWKGGVEKELKTKKKIGTLFYLAQWQGLRGDDLDVELDKETVLTCSATNVTVEYTGDPAKYGNA